MKLLLVVCGKVAEGQYKREETLCPVFAEAWLFVQGAAPCVRVRVRVPFSFLMPCFLSSKCFFMSHTLEQSHIPLGHVEPVG